MDDYPMLVHQSIGGGTEDELMIYWIDLISARKCYRTPNGYLGNVSRTLHNQILCSITWVLCYWASQLDIQPWPASRQEVMEMPPGALMHPSNQFRGRTGQGLAFHCLDYGDVVFEFRVVPVVAKLTTS